MIDNVHVPVKYIQNTMCSIPLELNYFFKGEPKSLVISGEYNSYHREIALSILNQHTHGKNTFYYSFKESKKNYGWMRKIPSGEDRFNPKYIDHFSLHHSTERIKKFYTLVKKIPENSFLFVDFLDELILDYKMRHDDVSIEEILYMLQRDIVDIGKINMVVVTSHDTPELRRIPDGFIKISVEKVYNYNLRVMRTENLKNIHEEKIYLVGFSGLKYHFFSQSNEYREGFLKPAMKIERKFISTGIRDLDNFLGGGLFPGSYNIIEVESSIPEEIYRLFLYFMAIHNIKKKRGVLIAPAESVSSDLYYKILSNYMKSDEGKYLKILKSTPIVERKSYIVDGYARTPDDRHEIWKTTMNYLNGVSSGPVIDITEYGAIESSFSKDSVIHLVSEGIKWLSEWKDIGIGVISSESEIKNKLMYLAKRYVKIFDYHGLYCITGIKPRGGIKMIYIDTQKGAINLHLKRVI